MELKELAEGLKSDFDAFKKANDTLLAAKAEGKALGELTAKVEALNKALDEKQAKIDAIATAMKRTPQGTEAEKADVSEKVMRKAFREFLSKGDRGSLADAIGNVLSSNADLKAAYFEHHPELKALAVSDDTAGGFMVHADLTGRIIKRIFETSPIRQYAAVASISTDALEGPLDNNQADAGWVAEQGSRPQTNTPKIGMWRIPTHELYAQPAATQKLLDDAAWDPESWLAAKVADRIARIENTAFVSGTGVGQPKGFLSEDTISDASGASASYDTYTADKKIGYIPTGVSGAFPAVPVLAASTAQGNPLLDAVYAMKTQYRDTPGCAWAMHRTTVGAIRKLQDAMGRYLWEPGLGGQPQTFFGFPIAEFNDMPVIAANSLSIAFANWREAYQIVDRAGLRILRDPYTAKPFVLFYTTKRVGGAVLNHEAIKLIKFAAS